MTIKSIKLTVNMNSLSPNNLHIRKQGRRSVIAKLTSAFVFATWIVQFLYFLNPRFAASSHLLWSHSLVCVRPGRKHRLLVFSREVSFLCLRDKDRQNSDWHREFYWKSSVLMSFVANEDIWHIQFKKRIFRTQEHQPERTRFTLNQVASGTNSPMPQILPDTGKCHLETSFTWI